MTQQELANVKLVATDPRLIRRAGGGHFFLYKLTGTAAALQAYEDVMSQVKVKSSRSGTALIKDPVTGVIFFPQPTGANGDEFNVIHAPGNPDVNPLGRFVSDDARRVMAQDVQLETMINGETAKILAMRRLGIQTQPLVEPRGNSSQSGVAGLTAEEIEAGMKAAENDANG